MGLATIMNDIAPVFERPQPDAVRLDEVLYGMTVQLVQQSDTGWSYVRTEYSTEGYMPTASLQTDSTVATAWRKYKKVTVLAPYVDVQTKADGDAPRVVSVPRGGILVTLGQPGIDGWQKVGLVNGAIGYTRASYLGDVITAWEEMSEEDVRWNLVETALSYNGTAWRSGGRSPLGMDALGLVSMSFLMNGILLPRSAVPKAGGPLHPIAQRDMNEGDVLYFNGSMGIYMGDSRFVHATDVVGGEGVVVSSMRAKDDDYRGDLAEHIVAVASIY